MKNRLGVQHSKSVVSDVTTKESIDKKLSKDVVSKETQYAKEVINYSDKDQEIKFTKSDLGIKGNQISNTNQEREMITKKDSHYSFHQEKKTDNSNNIEMPETFYETVSQLERTYNREVHQDEKFHHQDIQYEENSAISQREDSYNKHEIREYRNSGVQSGYQFKNVRYVDGIKILKKENQIDDYRKEEKRREIIKKKDKIINSIESVTDESSIQAGYKFKNARYVDGIKFLKKEKQIDDYKKEEKIRKTVKKKDEIINPVESIIDENIVQSGYQFKNARYVDGIKFLKKEKQIDDYKKEEKIRKTVKKKDEIINPVKSVTEEVSFNLHVKRNVKEEILQDTAEKLQVINQKNGAKYTNGIISRKIDIVDKNSLNGVFKTKKKEKRTIYETNANKNKEYVKRTGEKIRTKGKKRSGKDQEEANGNKKAKSFFKRELKRKILTRMTNGEKKEEDHMSSGIGSLFTTSFKQKIFYAITSLLKKFLALILSELLKVLGILLLIIVAFLAVAFLFIVVIFIIIALCQSVVGFFYQDYSPEINTNPAYFGTVFNEKVRGFNNYIQEWNSKTYTVTFTETKKDGSIEVKQEEKHYTSTYISDNDNYAEMLTLYLVLVSDYSNLEILTGEGWNSTNLPYLIVDTTTEKEIINKIFNSLYYTEVDPHDEHKLLIYKKPASNYLTKYPFTTEQKEVYDYIKDAMEIQIVAGGISDVEAPDVKYDDATVNKIFEEGNKYLGRKYVYGGSNPNTGFDCSGFVCWVYNKAGASSIGRTTAQGLYNNCTPIKNEADAKPGDLIFFKGTYDCGEVVTHVGIYAGNGTMLHCGDPIQYTSIHSSYWDSHFYSFGRLK